MGGILLVPYYLSWHYSRGLSGVVKITMNIAWFLWHFFSIKILLKTLFYPWERLQEKKENNNPFDVSGLFGVLVINTIMRIVGAIIRLTFIVFGLLSILAVIISGFFFVFVWLALPLLIIFSLVFGIILLIGKP